MKMENFKDNNRFYNVVMQGIDIAKTSTFQEVCIYPDRDYITYNWYWSMEYTCTIDPSDNKFILPEFAETVFKIGESRIDSKVSHMFRKVYDHFYWIVQQYRKSE